MNKYLDRIVYGPVAEPTTVAAAEPVDLDDATMKERLDKILAKMNENNDDALVIYADREHGGNFGYLTGFEPRFEEIALVLHKDGKAYLMLGNESLKMQKYSRVAAEAVHTPYFSLPNQPMGNTLTMEGLFKEAGLSEGMKVGIAGWKMFTSALESNQQLYDVPYFIVQAIKNVVGQNTYSAGAMFIHPGQGARIINNANEIAHYEFGASLASHNMHRMQNAIEIGKTELELADLMEAWGQPNNVMTICATGERFTNAVVAPRNKKVSLGDKFSSTIGYRGGLTSRSAYVVENEEQLDSSVRDYIDAVVKPYYSAAVAWYENIGLDVTGGDIYALIESVIPKADYHWELNPGHHTSDEEWSSSPMDQDSTIKIQSGMMLQMDIIPSVSGYGGASAEDGVAIADEALRNEIKEKYPDVWARMQARREYLENELGIHLKEEVLPLSNMIGYMRPYLLNKSCAMKATGK